MGAEGQYAFVIPAYDLVIVHRINSDIPASQRKEPTSSADGAAALAGVVSGGDKDVGRTSRWRMRWVRASKGTC